MKFRRVTSLVSLSVIAMLCVSFVYASDEPVKLYCINVGNGESMLIETPHKKNILIDSGNLITGSDVYRFLKEKNITTLDHLIISHPHLDHCGGVFALSHLIPAQYIYDNGQPFTTDLLRTDVYQTYNECVRNHAHYTALCASDTIPCDGLSLQILSPTRGVWYPDWNDNSLVLFVQYNTFSCLLMGDVSRDIEEKLVDAYPQRSATVLKAGHHGAPDTASAHFIDCIKPEIVLISTDPKNKFGYPSPDVIQRYKDAGATVYTTYEHGTIVITVEPDGKYHVQTHI